MNHSIWDAKYQASPRVFSGLPNPTLVTETANLPAGRALDIGCGEGADAIWLVERGWRVVATDIAPTALRRAAQTKSDQAHRITWIQRDIIQDPPPEGPFDLVTMHYVPLPKEAAPRVFPALLEAIAPGGVLLFVTHDIQDLEPRPDFDPYHYCQPGDVARHLGRGWTVCVNERRRRGGRAPQGTKHVHDAILCARRET